MRKRIVFIALIGLLVLRCGCETDSSLMGDAGSTDILETTDTADTAQDEASSATCSFTVTELRGQGPFTCVIEPDSETSCVDALDCICRVLSPGGNQAAIDNCIGWELVARGAETMADFCDVDPPGSHSLADALPVYFLANGVPEDGLSISAGCGDVAALIGPRPFEVCAMLDGTLCPCIPGICDISMLLDMRCVELSRDEAWCVYDEVTLNPDDPCGYIGYMEGVLDRCEE